jgi:hypothetical protein
MEGRGIARNGMAWQVRTGTAWNGAARLDTAGYGMDGIGTAGVAWPGVDRRVMARQGTADSVWRASAG